MLRRKMLREPELTPGFMWWRGWSRIARPRGTGPWWRKGSLASWILAQILSLSRRHFVYPSKVQFCKSVGDFCWVLHPLGSSFPGFFIRWILHSLGSSSAVCINCWRHEDLLFNCISITAFDCFTLFSDIQFIICDLWGEELAGGLASQAVQAGFSGTSSAVCTG